MSARRRLSPQGRRYFQAMLLRGALSRAQALRAAWAWEAATWRLRIIQAESCRRRAGRS